MGILNSDTKLDYQPITNTNDTKKRVQRMIQTEKNVESLQTLSVYEHFTVNTTMTSYIVYVVYSARFVVQSDSFEDNFNCLQ